MHLKFKKFVYLLNDITNLILQKERKEEEEGCQKLKLALIIVSISLFISFILNLYLTI